MFHIYPDIIVCFQKSRLEKKVKGADYKQKLFASIGNVYISENTAPPRRDLIQLIGLCGGQVCYCEWFSLLCVHCRIDVFYCN